MFCLFIFLFFKAQIKQNFGRIFMKVAFRISYFNATSYLTVVAINITIQLSV